MRSQESVRNLNYLILVHIVKISKLIVKHLKIDSADQFSTQKFVFFANLPFVPKIIGDRIL